MIHSCALNSERSFQEIMVEQEEYYVAGRDFRFMSGDTGKRHYTQEEIMERTPAAERLAPELREQIQLRREVTELEQVQPQIFVEQYDRYKEYFATESEKVYYLRLTSMEERERFLIDKGIKRAPANVANNNSGSSNFSDRDSWEYKSKSAVWNEFGAPQKVESSSESEERWTYELPKGTGARSFYFSGEKVKEVQQDRRYP